MKTGVFRFFTARHGHQSIKNHLTINDTIVTLISLKPKYQGDL